MKTSILTRLIASLSLMLLAVPAFSWTVSADNEGVAVGSRCPGWAAFKNSVVTNENKNSGSQSCKMSIRRGSEGWEEFGGYLGFPQGVSAGQEIWVRFALYFMPGYDLPHYGPKFFRLQTGTDSDHSSGFIDMYLHDIGDRAPFWIRYEPDVLIYGEDGAWRYLGANNNMWMKRGVWETYEFYAKLDDVPASQGGRSLIRVWKNGELVGEIKDIRTLQSKSIRSNLMYLFTYWNGGATQDQYVYLDDLKVTTDTPSARDKHGNPFIGPVGAAAAPPEVRPMPPTGVTVN